jgi:DNA-binding response OmpR family regulator
VTESPPEILLADADPAARAAREDALAAAGYAVTAVPDGGEALDRLADPLAVFEAAVLAERLPGMGGRDVLRVARSWGVETPVLVLAGGPDPVDPAALVRSVVDLLGRRTRTSCEAS